MRTFLLFLTCCMFLSAFADPGDGDYAVSKIAPALLKNADAVLRLEETRFELLSQKEAVEKYRYVITVLNENGDKWAYFADGYDKLRSISSVEGYLYDASGKQIRKMKPKDLQDVSGTDDNNLVDDNRVKQHNFYYKVYPYTIEYYEEIRYKYTLFFPRWIPQGSEKLSVESSRITIVCPASYEFRYKAFNYKGDPVVAEEKDKKTFTWQVSDLAAILKEPFAPRMHELTTEVIFGPTDFQVDDYKGSMKDWQGFGKFVWDLKSGKDALPDGVKQKVHDLTDGVSDPKEKIRKLYEYMQHNTRYISIQLGIGGWQPFDATYVASKGYGDCKALTNYMYSLLKEAGIRSCYTLVRAGRNERYITSDFPSQQFNHVILSVPLPRDTMWLECTSQILAAGYLSDFTCDRDALMVTEDGGHLVHTPVYGINENLCIRRVKGVLEPGGTLAVQSYTRYAGLQQDDRHDLINYLSKDKVKEYLQRDLDFATYDIRGFKYDEIKKEVPEIEERLDIDVSNYATITGKRLFISPNVMSRNHSRYKKDDDRKYDVVIPNEYKDVDSVEIELPAGFMIESRPENELIESKFGKYRSTLKVEGNKLFYYRDMEYYRGRFPATEYNNLVTFFDDVYKADRKRVVFLKDEKAQTQEPAKKAF